MSEFGEIQGYMFHFRDGKPLMEGDNLIPAYACLCAARSAVECGCGAFDWPIPKRDEMEKIESIARNYQPTTDGNDMTANIEALVVKHCNDLFNPDVTGAQVIRNALTEQAEAFKGELSAYDGTVRELTKTVEDMRAVQSVPVVGEPTDAAYKWMIANGVEPLTSLHKLGERLAAFLDEDQFSGCETLLLTAITAINAFVPVPAAELASLREQAETHAIELRAYETTVANLEGRIRVVSDALTGLVAIAHDSDGVAGYHKNGDIADWYSFPEFEAAVIAIDAAIAQGKGE